MIGTFITFTIPILEFFIKQQLKDEFTGVISDELVDAAGEHLKGWLGKKSTRKQLQQAAIQAEHEFENRIGSPDLKALMSDLSLGASPQVQAAIKALPEARDESDLEESLRAVIARDWKNITDDETDRAVKVFLACLEDALMPLEEVGVGVMRVALVELKKRVERVETAVEAQDRQISELKTAQLQLGTPVLASLHQLPAPPGGFVGRETELEKIVRQEKGLISGMGGAGKTALGLVAAYRLAEKYSEGQFFIDLRGTAKEPANPFEVMKQIILGFQPGTDLRQAAEEQVRGLYYSLLNGKSTLLFMDNARNAAQVQPLLPPPGNAVLVTSRVNFRIAGMGMAIRLDALPENQAGELLANICERLSEDPAAREIAGLCGCLPLALKIAGTLLAEHLDWSGQEFIERLKKQRLQTLTGEDNPAESVEAVIELSYRMLNEQEQGWWRALAVMAGSFSREALAAVCGLDGEQAREFAGKVERMSLLGFDQNTSRYRLHDLLSEFAKLRTAPDEDFQSHWKHGVHYLEIEEKADALYLQGGEKMSEGLQLFDREWEQIQAAQAWAAQNLERGAALLAMRLPHDGFDCLGLRLNTSDQLGWLESGLKAARLLKDKDYESAHLGRLGTVLFFRGESGKAIGYFEQSLELAREIRNRSTEGAALGNLGAAYKKQGETGRAIEYYNMGLEIARATGDRRGEANMLGNLGIAFMDLGELPQAVDYFDKALALDRQSGDRQAEGLDLGNLGVAYHRLGETEKAIEYYSQALVLSRDIGDLRSEGNALGNLGNVFEELNEIPLAIEHFEKQLVITRKFGDRGGEGNALGSLGLAHLKLGELRQAIIYYDQALVIERELVNRKGEADSLFHQGVAFQYLGEIEMARYLGGKALLILEEIKVPDVEPYRKWLKSLDA